MYILLSCTSLIIKECPASTHNLCQSNVKHSVLKQVCMHTKLQLGVINILSSKDLTIGRNILFVNLLDFNLFYTMSQFNPSIAAKTHIQY